MRFISVIVVVFTVLAAGCRSGTPVPRAHDARTAGDDVFWKDEVDLGDAPFTAGCHYQYADAACTRRMLFFSGDSCEDATHLVEWTNPECHQPNDTKQYDCDAECKKLGKRAGLCRRSRNACGFLDHSARCVCS